MIRVTVWGENIHEKKNKTVAEIYPTGMHTCIAEGLNQDKAIKAVTATLDQPEHGLTDKVLDETDVLTWWGHAGHDLVEDVLHPGPLGVEVHLRRADALLEQLAARPLDGFLAAEAIFDRPV